MKIKLLLTFVLALSLPAISFAQTSSTASGIRESAASERAAVASSLAAYKSANAAKKLTSLLTVGDKAVTARQKVINGLTAKINSGSCKSIDDATKTILTADIAKINESLNTQKTKLAADTDLTTAKTDLKAIYTVNRVFIHFIPAVNGVCASERIIELVNGTKITNAVTSLKNQGISTTAIESSLDDAKTSAESALVLFEKVAADPSDSNTTAKDDLQTALTSLKNARKSLNDAKSSIEAALSTLDETTGSSPTE